MHIRRAQPKLRPIVAAAALPAALVGLALTFASSPAAAQQWTPEQRAACEPERKSGVREQGRLISLTSRTHRPNSSRRCAAWVVHRSVTSLVS